MRRSGAGKRESRRKWRFDPEGIKRLFRDLGSCLLKAFVVASAVVIISLSFVFLYHYILESPYMKLRVVEVTGVDDKIRMELICLAGLSPDLSLLEMNLKRLKAKMERHPWVRSVTIERRFPRSLVVKAEKEVPCAMVVMDGIYYVNVMGEVFKTVEEGDDVDFPVITGLSNNSSEAREQLAEAGHLVRMLEGRKDPACLKDLSEIHLNRDGGLSIYFSDLSAEIKLVPTDLEEKLEGLKKVTDRLVGTGKIDQVNGIDLDYRDGAVISFKNG